MRFYQYSEFLTKTVSEIILQKTSENNGDEVLFKLQLYLSCKKEHCHSFFWLNFVEFSSSVFF